MYSDLSRKYWFFHREEGSNPLKYSEIIYNAEKSVKVWDPYFNNGQDEEIFDYVNGDVTIRLLTTKSLNKHPSFLDEVFDEVKSRVSKRFNIEFGIRVINKYEHSNRPFLFHDRFLFVDDSKVFLVGGSLGQHLPTQTHCFSTGVFEVDDDNTKNFIKEIFEYYWSQGKSNEKPVQFIT
jgi:hypothetical protein